MIRALVVDDDQELVRAGFRLLLDPEEDIEAVGSPAWPPSAVPGAGRDHRTRGAPSGVR